MKKVLGIELQFSSFEDGLWFDSDLDGYNPKGFGLKIALLFGKIIMPFPKIYKWDYWRSITNGWIGKTSINYNPWSSGNHWFVLRIHAVCRLLAGMLITAGLYFLLPLWLVVVLGFFLVGGFVSLAVGPYGFYIGNKTYGADRVTHPHYLRWMRFAEIGKDQVNPSYFLCFSSTTRKTRWI